MGQWLGLELRLGLGFYQSMLDIVRRVTVYYSLLCKPL